MTSSARAVEKGLAKPYFASCVPDGPSDSHADSTTSRPAIDMARTPDNVRNSMESACPQAWRTFWDYPITPAREYAENRARNGPGLAVERALRAV
jgi:hypothetical protein